MAVARHYIRGVFFCLAFVAGTSGALADCNRWLDPVAVAGVKAQLHTEIAQTTETLESIEINSAELVFEKELGSGAQGVAMLVHQGDRQFALKLFRSGRRENFRQAVIIQKNLHTLGMAAEVFGVLNATEVDRFLARNRGSLSRYNQGDQYSLGVLMELTSPQFLKDRYFWRAVQVTPEQKRTLRAQARAYMAILEELSIEAHDIDAVVGDQGQLLLADMGAYRMHEERALDPGDEWLAGKGTDPVDNLLSKINFGTSTLQARFEKLKSIFGAAK